MTTPRELSAEERRWTDAIADLVTRRDTQHQRSEHLRSEKNSLLLEAENDTAARKRIAELRLEIANSDDLFAELEEMNKQAQSKLAAATTAVLEAIEQKRLDECHAIAVKAVRLAEDADSAAKVYATKLALYRTCLEDLQRLVRKDKSALAAIANLIHSSIISLAARAHGLGPYLDIVGRGTGERVGDLRSITSRVLGRFLTKEKEEKGRFNHG
jgi:hypothetical protein